MSAPAVLIVALTVYSVAITLYAWDLWKAMRRWQNGYGRLLTELERIRARLIAKRR